MRVKLFMSCTTKTWCRRCRCCHCLYRRPNQPNNNTLDRCDFAHVQNFHNSFTFLLLVLLLYRCSSRITSSCYCWCCSWSRLKVFISKICPSNRNEKKKKRNSQQLNGINAVHCMLCTRSAFKMVTEAVKQPFSDDDNSQWPFKVHLLVHNYAKDLIDTKVECTKQQWNTISDVHLFIVNTFHLL